VKSLSSVQLKGQAVTMLAHTTRLKDKFDFAFTRDFKGQRDLGAGLKRPLKLL
jgi:hypothetical protein